MSRLLKKNLNLFTRNFIFGVEDALVSTVGLVSGVAVTIDSKYLVILTGCILIFVEAFSMGVGSFLSEKAIEEGNKKSNGIGTIIAAIIMFVSYMIAGFIPLAPYILLSKDLAFTVSIVCSVIALFVLGFYSGYILKINAIKNAIRMMLLSSLAISLGIIVGKFVESAQGKLI